MKLTFYHYQSLAEVTQLGFLESKLEQKVWLTPLNRFNDPFEGHAFHIPTPPEYYLRDPVALKELLPLYNEQNSSHLTEKELTEGISTGEFKEKLGHLAPIRIKKEFCELGALCLTKDYHNIPMWSYYADNNKGCCIIFELDFSLIRERINNNQSIVMTDSEVTKWKDDVYDGRELLSFHQPIGDHNFFFLKVKYGKDLPILDGGKLFEYGDQFSKQKYIVENTFGYKSKKWEHEAEFRLICNTNSDKSGILPLCSYAPFLKVTGVIMGSAMPDFLKNHVKYLCDKYQIELFQSVLSQTKYEIDISSVVEKT